MTTLLVLLVIGGGQQASVAAPRAQSLAIAGSTSAIHAARQVVARDADQFLKLWREHTGRPTSKYAPYVDFRGHDLVAVYAGPKNTGGYSISIDSVKNSGHTATVMVTVHKPKPGAITTQAFTYPFDMKAVPKLPPTVN